MTRSDEGSGHASVTRWVGILALWGLILVAFFGVRRLQQPPPPPASAADVTLHRWSLLGCWDLVAEGWRSSLPAADSLPGAVGGSELPPMPRSDAMALGGVLEGRLPRGVMLASDSVDQWGRELDSYRAVVLDSGSTEEARWFVRADTLWIIQSGMSYRTGIALFDRGDRFSGLARTVGDSLDATANVTAYRANCATGIRRVPRRWRR